MVPSQDFASQVEVAAGRSGFQSSLHSIHVQIQYHCRWLKNSDLGTTQGTSCDTSIEEKDRVALSFVFLTFTHCFRFLRAPYFSVGSGAGNPAVG